MRRFDFSDPNEREKIMNEHEMFDTPLVGVNDDDENVIVTVFEDRIEFVTYQKNGWCRINIYHRDGTYEELYKKN